MALANDNLDLGVWSRTTPLTRQQIKNRQELFARLQSEYNKTHNTDILWHGMYRLLEEAVKSAILKVNKYNFVEDFEDKTLDGLDLLLTRYINKPDYNFKSLATLSYWAAIYASRKPNVIARDKEQSYEVLMDEKLMHEEHIIDDFYEYDYTDDSSYDVDELY